MRIRKRDLKEKKLLLDTYLKAEKKHATELQKRLYWNFAVDEQAALKRYLITEGRSRQLEELIMQ